MIDATKIDDQQPETKGDVAFDFGSSAPNIAFQALKSHAEEQIQRRTQEPSFLGKTQESAPIKATIPTIRKQSSKSKFRSMQLAKVLGILLLGFVLSELRFLWTENSNSIFGYFLLEHPHPYHYIVTEPHAKLKRGPGDHYETVGQIKQGSLLGSLAMSNGWFRIDYGQYLHPKMIQKLPALSSWKTYRWDRVKNRVIKVYAAPHYKSQVITHYKYGDRVKIKDLNARWAFLEEGGFIDKRQLRKSYGGSSYMRVKKNKAIVYLGPGSHHGIAGMLQKNKVVKALVTKKGWIKVGKKKYVKASDLKPYVGLLKGKNARSQP